MKKILRVVLCAMVLLMSAFASSALANGLPQLEVLQMGILYENGNTKLVALIQVGGKPLFILTQVQGKEGEHWFSSDDILRVFIIGEDEKFRVLFKRAP